MSQKIPLFDGVLFDVPPPIATFDIFTPPDKALLQGSQAFYEAHLWWTRGSATDYIEVLAYNDGDAANAKRIWEGGGAAAPWEGYPVKVLDGYPIRGNVTLQGVAEAGSSFLFGYYTRVGESDAKAARRFNGQPSPDANNVSLGVPVELAAGESAVIHTFEQNRIDEVSLALIAEAEAAPFPAAAITFEDASNAVLSGPWAVSAFRGATDFTSPLPLDSYFLREVAFGGNPALPTLDHIRITADGGNAASLWAHGYFTRR